MQIDGRHGRANSGNGTAHSRRVLPFMLRVVATSLLDALPTAGTECLPHHASARRTSWRLTPSAIRAPNRNTENECAANAVGRQVSVVTMLAVSRCAIDLWQLPQATRDNQQSDKQTTAGCANNTMDSATVGRAPPRWFAFSPAPSY
jgi:hypothetical protein